MAKTNFKVGDRIKTTGDQRASSHYRNREAVIYAIESNKQYPLKLRFDNGDVCSWCDDGDIKLIKKSMSTIKEKIKMKLKQEPEKSNIKAGLRTLEDDFTSEGREAFLEYLYQKDKDDFKKEVALPILEAMKEEEK